MSDPSLALQAAIVTALKTAATAAGNNVFDEVPHGNPFPRFTVGDGQDIPLNDEADEACDYDPTETFIEVNAWSRATGFPQVKQMAADAREALHNVDLNLTGHTLMMLRIQDINYSRDPDGKTRRARMTLRALTQPEDPASP